MGYTVFGIRGVAPTLTAATSRHYERYKIGPCFRRLTNIEYARLQGFPDEDVYKRQPSMVSRNRPLPHQPSTATRPAMTSGRIQMSCFKRPNIITYKDSSIAIFVSIVQPAWLMIFDRSAAVSKTIRRRHPRFSKWGRK